MPNIKVDEKLVKHVAMLAKLNLNEAEVANYVQYMHKVLGYVESLDKVDTSSVEGFFGPVMDLDQVYSEKLKSPFKFHEDKVQSFANSEKILDNAPKKEAGQFKIKAIIEEQ